MTTGLRLAKGGLEGAEEAPSAGQGNDHGAELAKEFVPEARGNALGCARDRSQQVVKAQQAVRGERDSGGVGINDPTQDKFAGGPGAIPLTELFFGGRFLAVDRIGWEKGTEDPVKGVQEFAFDVTPPRSGALDYGDKIVNVHIGVGNRLAGIVEVRGADVPRCGGGRGKGTERSFGNTGMVRGTDRYWGVGSSAGRGHSDGRRKRNGGFGNGVKTMRR